MKAGEVMSPRVITVASDATIADAARIMLEHGISGLPVVDAAGTLVGIVTEGDFLRRAETGTERQRPKWLEFLLGPGRAANDYVHSHARKIAEVMTPVVITASEAMPLQDVVTTMERRRIKRLPVMSEGKVVGIISRANLVQALARLAQEAPATSTDDETARQQILAELNKQSWAPRNTLNVIVRGGVAELWGEICDEREREAIRVAAENVAGIAQVIDNLVYIQPISVRAGIALPPLRTT